MRHLDETGVYCHVIARGSMTTGGDIAKAIVCGADGVMLGTPLGGGHRGPGARLELVDDRAPSDSAEGPASSRCERLASLEVLLTGPATDGTGRLNLAGALRRSMALCGYESVKDFQKAELVVRS